MSEIIRGFLSNTITFISVYLFGKIVFSEKLNNKKTIYNILLVLIFISLYSVAFLLLDGTIKTVVLCILYMLTYKIIFNVNIGKSLLSGVIYLTILIIPELITMTVAIYILKIPKDYIYNTFAGSLIGNLIVSILMTLFSYMLRKALRKIININISTNKKMIGISALILISLAIFFYDLIKVFQFNNDIAGFLVAIIALITILVYVFKQKFDNEKIAKKYDELLDIMKNYENDIEEQRTLIHETKNELTTIMCKIKDKEKESEIIEYINSIIGDKVSPNMSKYSKFKYLPSNGLKGFFYYKFTEAERKDIDVSINISKQIENSFLGRLDTKDFKNLARIIGVYLDNAIEASSLSKKKQLGIEVYYIKEKIEIIISNTYDNIIEKERIGKEKYSTKGKNRGHGLLLVRKILEESKLITSENEITENLYIQKIILKNQIN